MCVKYHGTMIMVLCSSTKIKWHSTQVNMDNFSAEILQIIYAQFIHLLLGFQSSNEMLNEEQSYDQCRLRVRGRWYTKSNKKRGNIFIAEKWHNLWKVFIVKYVSATMLPSSYGFCIHSAHWWRVSIYLPHIYSTSHSQPLSHSSDKTSRPRHLSTPHSFNS